MKKRKDGYYRVSRTIDGKVYYFYGKTQSEAKRKCNSFEVRRVTIPFKDAAEEWFEHHSASLAFNTIRGYIPSYERALDEFGDMNLTDITPLNVSKYIRRMADMNYSDKTVRTQLGVISMICQYAINYMGIDMTNPARDIKIPKGLQKEKVTLPSDEDIQKVKESVTEEFGLFAYMLMYTGLRRGEVLALRYEDIKDGFINIDKSIYYDGNTPKVKRPKTERSVRRVPVLDKLSPYLSRKKGIIFNHLGEYLPYHVFLRKWGNYCKTTGIKCTPHQLRHCFATMLYEADISPKDAQYLLGHSQISTTLDIYTDIRQQREKHIADEIKSIDIG